MALANAVSREAAPPSQVQRIRMIDEARGRGWSAQQLEDLLDLWRELYWYPPTGLPALVDELAR